MKPITMKFAFLIGMLSLNAGAKEPLTDELKALFIGRIEAFAKCDSSKVSALCTKDYQFISSSGNKYTVTQIPQLFNGQVNQMKSYTILSFQPYFIEHESMSFVIAEIEEEVLDGTLISKNSLIITEIYRKENKKWKIQLTQQSQKSCNFEQ
jgi:hypothetical protein